ncbi:transposase, partial [Candidatus Peregrinibacteria bacterium]|nr:transposase [Candidatus Peregrinibacteria bacterium]
MRQGARQLRTNFAAASLTRFGGIYLVHSFFQRLCLRAFPMRKIDYPQRNNHYTLSEMPLALMYPMILGLEKIEVSALLKTNGVFGCITGLPTFPDPQTFRRFLVRAAPELLPQLRSAHDQLRARFLCLPTTPSSFWIDCDSTACALCGKQEGAVKGCNPNHRGGKSCHPLIVTEGHRGDCLAGLLRHGNAHAAEGADALIERARCLLPHRRDLRLRADSGFYDGSLVRKVREQMEFAIVAKMTAPVKAAAQGKSYQRISRKFSTSAFSCKPHGWAGEERFVILRRRLPPEELEEQTLFTLDAHAHSVIATNLPLTPYNVFQFCGDRMGMERIIRMLKDDYPFGAAP